MAAHNQDSTGNVCKYKDFEYAEEFSLDYINVLNILGKFKTRMVIHNHLSSTTFDH